MVIRQLQVERRRDEVRRAETDALRHCTTAYRLNLVECSRIDFPVVDERELVGGVAGTPDLQVDRRRVDEERRETEQFTRSEELIREHDH